MNIIFLLRSCVVGATPMLCFTNDQTGQRSQSEIHVEQRGTYICAHVWSFFKPCILMNHYIQTMKMYLSNKIVSNKA